MILGEVEYTTYLDEQDESVSATEVSKDEEGNRVASDGRSVRAVSIEESALEKKGETFVLRSNPNVRVESRAFKMSKSRGNVVNPDDIVQQYGADSLRLYEMFMGASGGYQTVGDEWCWRRPEFSRSSMAHDCR